MTNLKHHNFGYDFSDGCVEEVAHGFAIDADWKDILPHCGQLFELMDDLQPSKTAQRCQRQKQKICFEEGSGGGCFEEPAYLPYCFVGCYVVVFIIQVAEIMSSRQPLQEFSSLNIHLCQEASSTWTKTAQAQHHVLKFRKRWKC